MAANGFLIAGIALYIAAIVTGWLYARRARRRPATHIRLTIHPAE